MGANDNNSEETERNVPGMHLDGRFGGCSRQVLDKVVGGGLSEDKGRQREGRDGGTKAA